MTSKILHHLDDWNFWKYQTCGKQQKAPVKRKQGRAQADFYAYGMKLYTSKN